MKKATRHFLSRNRGKHSLPLDLRHPAAARIVGAIDVMPPSDSGGRPVARSRQSSRMPRTSAT